MHQDFTNLSERLHYTIASSIEDDKFGRVNYVATIVVVRLGNQIRLGVDFDDLRIAWLDAEDGAELSPGDFVRVGGQVWVDLVDQSRQIEGILAQGHGLHFIKPADN